MTAATLANLDLESFALRDYEPRTCRCGELVEPRFARFDEQLEMSGGKVPTVVWDCPRRECGEKRAEPHEAGEAKA